MFAAMGGNALGRWYIFHIPSKMIGAPASSHTRTASPKQIAPEFPYFLPPFLASICQWFEDEKWAKQQLLKCLFCRLCTFLTVTAINDTLMCESQPLVFFTAQGYHLHPKFWLANFQAFDFIPSSKQHKQEKLLFNRAKLWARQDNLL